jgi:hypothetical protein
MTAKAERNVGLTLAAAGVGIIGIAVVFGLTTADGGPDWVGIITAGRADHGRDGPVQSVPSRRAPRRLGRCKGRGLPSGRPLPSSSKDAAR